MRHYLFEDNESGEQFIVGAECYTKACTIAKEVFEKAEYLYRMSELEAEVSGLDEY